MKKTLYLSFKQLFNEKIDKYLEGLTIVRKHWKELFDEYKDDPNVFFICDPPYYNTWNIQYEHPWSLKDSIETLEVMKYPCIYFTSDKSGLDDVMEFLSEKFDQKFDIEKKVLDRGRINVHPCKNNEIIYFKI